MASKVRRRFYYVKIRIYGEKMFKMQSDFRFRNVL